MSAMQLLVSVRSVEEALAVAACDVDGLNGIRITSLPVSLRR